MCIQPISSCPAPAGRLEPTEGKTHRATDSEYWWDVTNLANFGWNVNCPALLLICEYVSIWRESTVYTQESTNMLTYQITVSNGSVLHHLLSQSCWSESYIVVHHVVVSFPGGVVKDLCPSPRSAVWFEGMCLLISQSWPNNQWKVEDRTFSSCCLASFIMINQENGIKVY